MIALFTTVLGLSVAGLIVFLIRRDRLHVDHGLHWIIVAIGFALLGFAPDLIDRVAVRINIAYPPVLGLTLAIVVLVVKVLLMDIDRSHLRLKHQRLAQRVAILEGRLNRLAGGTPAHTGVSENGPMDGANEEPDGDGPTRGALVPTAEHEGDTSA